MAYPEQQGLYDPAHEHDACGVGFVANIKGMKTHETVGRGLEILINIDHRGAVGADPLVGDGAGILIQIPDELLRDWAGKAGVDLPQPGDYAVAMCFLPRLQEAQDIIVAKFERFIEKEGQPSRLPFNELLLALGREPRLALLGLEELGLELDGNSLVDERLQTRIPNLYVCGDAAGR